MNHVDKIKVKINSDTFLGTLDGLCSQRDICLDLLECIKGRVNKGHTQEYASILSGKSIATIKRFEQGEVDSLFLYCFYMDMFKDIPNRKKKVVPKWVKF